VHLVNPDAQSNAAMAEFVKAAAARGLTVGIENGRYNNSGKPYDNVKEFYEDRADHSAAQFTAAIREIAALLTPAEREFLRVTFDVPRAAASRDGDPLAYYAAIRETGIPICNTHLAQTDFDRYTKRPVFEPGSIPIIRLLELYTQHGYAGYINQEIKGAILHPRQRPLSEKPVTPGNPGIATEASADTGDEAPRNTSQPGLEGGTFTLDSVLRLWSHMGSNWRNYRIFEFPLLVGDHRVLGYAAIFSMAALPVVAAYQLIGSALAAPLTIAAVLVTILVELLLGFSATLHLLEAGNADGIRHLTVASDGSNPAVDARMQGMIDKFEHSTGWRVRFSDRKSVV
jgi:hypothetical protein